MCESNLLYEEADVVAGKLLLIGRAYAAAVERGEETGGNSDGYYYGEIVPEFVMRHEKLDERSNPWLRSICISIVRRPFLFTTAAQNED